MRVVMVIKISRVNELRTSMGVKVFVVGVQK